MISFSFDMGKRTNHKSMPLLSTFTVTALVIHWPQKFSQYNKFCTTPIFLSSHVLVRHMVAMRYVFAISSKFIPDVIVKEIAPRFTFKG